MNVFESIGEKTDRAGDIGEKYIKSSHQYFKLKLFQQLTFTVSMIAKLWAVGTFVVLGVIFGSVAGAISLGELLEDLALGYLAVAGIFFVIGLLIYATRNSINKYIIRKIGSKFFAEDE
ncbi:hypothetical protein BZARG_735 [Bizionia argentinensis JUB59]|uniref:Phage holin family protein n=1 Tax=Bizionia argentinensis JUB59 TaxID=1046627 RepID=G2EB52_9FLAO|nr:hypothetical protein [Bizionia argentinensis]EGV44411.2 hypothetical protein BZARG_735 [Bizionia argentinensis JUB59]